MTGPGTGPQQDGLRPGDDGDAAPSDALAPPGDPPAGPGRAPDDLGGGVPPIAPERPGSRVFDLDRPAAGLYLVAWLLTGVGLGLVLIALVSTSDLKVVLAIVALAMVVLGLAAGCGYQVVSRRASRPVDAYRGPSPLLLFVLTVAASLLAAIVLGALGVATSESGIGFLTGLVVVALSYVVAIVLFVVRTGSLSWREMGWPAGAGRVGRFVADAAFGLIVTVPFVVPVLIGAGLVAAVLQVQPTSQIPTVDAGLGMLMVVVGAAIVAPVGEEVFFRGFSLTAWQRDLGARAALTRSAAFFALVHVANLPPVANTGDFLKLALLQIAVIVPLGFVLGWVYQRHGIGASIAGHVGYNSTLLVLAVAAGQLGGAAG